MKHLKYLILATLLLAGQAFAQTTTPNIGLVKPPAVAGSWAVDINNNFDKLDALFPGGQSGHAIQNEGSTVTARGKLNFVGAGVDCVDNSGNASTDCTITSGGHTIQNESSGLPARSGLNFIGAGIDCVDNSGANRTDCTVPSATGDITDVFGTINEIEVVSSGGPQPTLSFASTISIPTKTLQLGRTELIGDISPSQITATQNDYNPTGLSTAVTLRLSSDASRNITGLQGGSDGRILTIHNVGAQNIVLVNQSGGSSAANRFAFTGDVTLGGDQSVTLQYDSTSSRWRLISGISGVGHTIQNEGTNLAARPNLNFIGAGIDCVDNAASSRTDCTVPSPTGDVTDVLGTTNEIEVTNSGGPQPTVAFPSTISIPNKTLQVGRFELIGDISPAQLTADVNDYNPSGLSTASTLRLSSDASRNITGLAGGSDGRILTLHNIGSQNIVLVDESASSAASNRFALSGNMSIGGDQSVTLQYDSTSGRWRVLSSSTSTVDQAASYTWTGTHTFSSLMQFAATSPAQITADQNNYSLGSTIVQRLSTDAPRTITGFVAPSGFRLVFIANIGTADIILAHESGSSTAANRIQTITTANITIPSNALAMLIYDNTTSRWRAFSMRNFVTIEADTLDTVFDRGKVIDGAGSFANAFRVTDSSGDGVVLYRSAANGPVVNCVVGGVEGDCDKIQKLNSGKKYEIRNSSSTPILTVTESTGKTTNISLDVEDTGNIVTTVSEINLPFVGCQGTGGSLLWDTLATNAPTATCSAGSTNSNMMRGVADFPDSDGDFSIQLPIWLPGDLSGNIDASFLWRAGATTGDVVWQLQTACTTDNELDDVAWNTAQTVADTANGTANRLNLATISNVTQTGCAAGEQLRMRVLRNRTHASDSITGVVSLANFKLKIRRTQ